MTTRVYKKGRLVRLEVDVKDINGALVDPSTLALKVVKPSGVTNTYTYGAAEITRISQGLYYKEITGDVHGLWLYDWTSTGTGQGAEHGEFMCEGRA